MYETTIAAACVYCHSHIYEASVRCHRDLELENTIPNLRSRISYSLPFILICNINLTDYSQRGGSATRLLRTNLLFIFSAAVFALC